MQSNNSLSIYRNSISLLKVKTDTLTVTPASDRLVIEYILEDKNAKRANKESVQRIDAIHSWLPMYNTYETNAILLPFPNAQIVEVVRQDAHKTISKKSIYSNFTVQLNKTWWSAIEQNYMADSAYTWQRHWVSLRQYAIKCSENAGRILELRLAFKFGKTLNQLIADFVKYAELFFKLYRTIPAFPKSITLTDQIDLFEQELKSLNNWTFSYSIFLNQFTALALNDDSQKKILALVNLKSAIFHMPAMLEGYNKIASCTYNYFDIEDLQRHEKYWYHRLQRTANFYENHVNDTYLKQVYDVDTTVAAWWKNTQQQRLLAVYKALDFLHDAYGYPVYKPKYILDEEFISEVFFGIDGISSSELESSFLNILISLLPLAQVDIDFYTVILAESGIAKHAFRLSREFIKMAELGLDGQEVSVEKYPQPLPVILDQTMLLSLPELTFQPQAQNTTLETVVRIYIALWKISETISRLNLHQQLERDWSYKIISQLNKEINDGIKDLEEQKNTTIHQQLSILKNEILIEKKAFTPSDCAHRIITFTLSNPC